MIQQTEFDHFDRTRQMSSAEVPKEEEDEVIDEIDVFVNQNLASNLYVLQYPLRSVWNPYPPEASAHFKVRNEPTSLSPSLCSGTQRHSRRSSNIFDSRSLFPKPQSRCRWNGDCTKRDKRWLDRITSTWSLLFNP